MEKVPNEYFLKLQELFDKIKNFKKPSENKTEEAGDSDSNTSIFICYEEIILEIDDIFKNVANNDENYIKLLCMQSSLHYEVSKQYMLQKKFDLAIENLEKALAVIKDYADNENIKYLYLRIVNHLSYLQSQYGEPEVAKNLLEEISNINVAENIKVYTTEDLFTIDKEPDQSEASTKLNRIILNNMQMLSWIYGKLKMVEEQIRKNHDSLQFQLNLNDANCIWVSRVARLSGLLMTKGYWDAARHHLAAASVILNSLIENTPDDPDLLKTQADVGQAWGYYGLRLFATSKAYNMGLLHADSGKSLDDLVDPPATTADTNPSKTEVVSCQEIQPSSSPIENKNLEKTTSQENCSSVANVSDSSTPSDLTIIFPEEEPMPAELRFENLNGIAAIETTVPRRMISNTLEARTLFLHTQLWLKNVRKYYTLKEHPVEYINCILQLSELYRYLTHYEEDMDSQYNVQKRRAETLEMLSNILRDTRPQCYMGVCIELLRELAEVQLEMMGLNMRKIFMLPEDETIIEDYKYKIGAISDLKYRLENMGDYLENSPYIASTHESVENYCS